MRQVSKPPEKVAADAVGEIERLQAVIAALGDSTTLVKLQEALRVAQTRASVSPIQERVDSCRLFLERAKKRVQRAQEVIDRVCVQKVLYEAEVVDGEEKLAKLVAEIQSVIFEDVRFCPIFNFGHFWAALLKISGFTPPEILAIFGPPPWSPF